MLVLDIINENKKLIQENSRLESNYIDTQAILSESQLRNELLSTQEEQLIRNRDNLENELFELDNKYRNKSMHQEELELSFIKFEEDLGIYIINILIWIYIYHKCIIIYVLYLCMCIIIY